MRSRAIELLPVLPKAKKLVKDFEFLYLSLKKKLPLTLDFQFSLLTVINEPSLLFLICFFISTVDLEPPKILVPIMSAIRVSRYQVSAFIR